IKSKKRPNSKGFPLPFNLLYTITYKELLIPKRILKDLLYKRFIKVSNFKAGIPILFIRKP
ncbi:hypothetical protein QR685DRAFT_409039, partial [Neurospora intermedia]